MRVLLLEARLEWKRVIVVFIGSAWLGWALAAAGSLNATQVRTTTEARATDEGKQTPEMRRLAERNRRLEALVDALEARTHAAGTAAQ